MPLDNFNTEGRRPLTWPLVVKGIFGSATLTGDVQLTPKTSQLLKIDPGGAGRNVDLPGPDEGLANSDGNAFLITNTADAAEDLTVRNPAGATVVTISQNERALVIGTGGAAWDHMGIETIALS